MQSNLWVTRTRVNPRLRLFCFPYAGGGTIFFRRWSDKLPAEVEVCPVHIPGREGRFKEPSYTQLSPLIEELTYALSPMMDMPFAFFGHSMGTLIAFELARALRQQQHQEPRALFVSAHRAPQLPLSRALLHTGPDAKLIETMKNLGGTPPAILEHTEMMSLMLPVMRADLTLYETYMYIPEAPFHCPIVVFGGKEDRAVREQELLAWREQTRSAFTYHSLPGGHFFLHSEQDRFLPLLSSELTKCL